MVVVVNDLRDFENGAMLTTEDLSGMGSISTGGSRSETKTGDMGLFTSDLVDGAEHGDRCIINPYNSKNGVVNDCTRECVPFKLALLVDLESWRELLGGNTDSATSTDLEVAQSLKRGILEKKLSI